MMGLPGDVTPRSDASGHPINRAFADVTYDKPTIEAEPGFEGPDARHQPVSTTSRVRT